MTFEEFDFRSRIQRDWNILLDSGKSRFEKQKSLNLIEQEWKSLCQRCQQKNSNPASLREQFVSSDGEDNLEWFILGSLQIATSESIEKIRCAAMNWLTNSYSALENWAPYLSIVLQVIGPRVTGAVRLEESEELRLSLIKFLHLILETRVEEGYKGFPIDQMGPLMNILTFTANDPFQDVRKQTFNLIILLCNKFSPLLKPHVTDCTNFITPSLAHRHGSVRALAVLALGRLLHVDVDSMLNMINNHLKKMLLDGAAGVRFACYQIAHDWCLDHKDAFNIHWMSIPFLLAGLSDVDSQRHIDFCKETLKKFGDYAELELRDQLRELRDFGASNPLVSFGPFKGECIGLGLSHLIHDALYKIVNNQLLIDLGDWQASVRLKALLSFQMLIPLAGNKCSTFVSSLYTSLWKISLADDDVMVKRRALETFPLFVNLVPSLASLINILLDLFNAPGSNYGGPETLLLFTKITDSILKSALAPSNGPSVLDADLSNRLIQTVNSFYRQFHTSQRGEKESFCSLVKNLLSLGAQADPVIVLDFILILGGDHPADQMPQFGPAIEGLSARDPNLAENYLLKCGNSFKSLSAFEQGLELCKLIAFNFNSQLLASGTNCWSLIFEVLLPAVTGQTADASVQIKFLELISTHVINRSERLGEVLGQRGGQDPAALFDSLFVPFVAWRPGRQFSAVREAAMRCLASSCCAKDDDVIPVSFKSFKHLLECLDEDSVPLKENAIKVLTHVFRQKDTFLHFTESDTLQLGKDIVEAFCKRLDDSEQSIRVESTKLITEFIRNSKSAPFKTMSSGNWLYLFKCLFIHLDDSDPLIQDSVFETLASSIHIFSHADNVKEAFGEAIKIADGKIKRAKKQFERLKEDSR